MNQVQIILVSEPHSLEIPAMRKQLRAVLQSLAWMPVWQEMMAGDPALPRSYRMLPGPFLIVNGKFVAVAEPEEMTRALRQAQDSADKWAWLRKPLVASSTVPGILIAFFPKCAGCWAAYFSVFGSLGIGLPYMPWMRHVLAGTLVLSVFYFARMAKRRNRWIPFGFQLAGFLAVLAAQYLLDIKSLLWVGVALVFAGSLLYAMPDTWMRKLEQQLRIGAV